ncbi:restriction endonuclease subunit S [Leyella lascolaii]|uniref:restriction endonuclease subunit S n=1 Tax=Leyella lascolaii TaxID=1776379 RepID=UPI0009FE5B6E|nr:restriction endonuclease subunit S [Leyella lascolaii]
MADNKDKKVLNVPALRFPEFSGEWDEYAIGEILSIGNGRDYKHLHNGDIPVFGTGGYMTSVDDFLYDGESVFVGRKGTINKPLYYNGKFWTVDTLFYTYNFTDVLPKFVYCLFQTINWLKYNEASGVPSLSKATIEKIKVRIPSMDEQDKLSNLLFLLDKRIEVQNKIIEKYESLIQAMCDTLIERETQQVTLSFGDFGQSYSGLSGKSAEDFGDGYPFITYMNVYQNQIIDSTDVGLVKINETEQQSVVRYGDILLTLSSETPEEVGMGAVYLGETYPLYLNSFCFGIHITDEAKIYPPFLAYYVSSQSFRKAVYPLAQGSTRFNLQKSDFMKKKFSFPVIEKQRIIYSFLKNYSDKLIVEKQIMRLLCNQKCYLLRQLFI